MSTCKFSLPQFSRIMLISVSLFTVSTSFATELLMPNSLTVKSIDGKTTSKQSLASGKHVIELVYRDDFAINADDTGSWVQSDPFYLVVNISEQQKLKLQLPELGSEDDAYAYIKKPQLKVSDELNKAVPAIVTNQNELMINWLKHFSF